MNQICLIGRLTRDVELRYISSGASIGTFAIAVDREFTGKDGTKETDFIEVQVWGKPAENCAQYIGKGSLVGINGSLRVERYKTKEGESRTMARVNANRVQFLDRREQNNQSGSGYQDFSKSNANNTTPTFDPSSLNPGEFQAIDEEDSLF